MKLVNFIKRLWTKLWSKTTIDEKVEEVFQETKRRASNMVVEAKDVAKAAVETVKQIDDIAKAAKGENRKGRKPKKNGSSKEVDSKSN